MSKQVFYDAQRNYNYFLHNQGEKVFGIKHYERNDPEQAISQINFSTSQGNVKINLSSKYSDMVNNDARLVITRSALSGGSGGSYNRMVNAAGIYMFEKFDIWQNGKLIESKTADDMFYELFYFTPQEYWSQVAAMIGYDTSTSNRNTAAASAATYIIPLRWFCSLFQKPVNLNVLADIQIRLYLRNGIMKCIQSDHSTDPTFTFTDFYIDSEYIEPYSKEVINYQPNLLINTDKKNKIYPWSFIDIEYMQKDFNLTASTTQNELDLGELDGKDVIDCLVIVRTATLVNTNKTSDYTDNNIALTSWNLKNDGKFIFNYQKDITVDYYNKVQLPRLYIANNTNILNRNEYMLSFCDDYVNHSKEDTILYSGSMDFSGIKNAKLTINHSSLAANSICTVLVRYAEITRVVPENGKGRLTRA